MSGRSVFVVGATVLVLFAFLLAGVTDAWFDFWLGWWPGRY